MRKLTKKEWKRRRRIKAILVLCFLILTFTSFAGVLVSLISSKLGVKETKLFGSLLPTKKVAMGKVDEMFLTPNEYSRPQTKLRKVKGIVVHYTGNPGSTAKGNRDYFESLKDTHTTSASSHFVVGLDGEVIQCLPLEEISYASNQRNKDTISIECCHPDENGKFTKETYDSLVQLVAWLCGEYNLKQNDIIRHYDVTGKICPKYYVENEEAWEQFKSDVFDYIEEHS